MKLKTLKCPECNANIEIEENRKTCFCTYCGCSILIDDESTTINHNYTYTKRDEARIRSDERKEKIRLKELENEEKQKKREHTETFLIVGLLLFCMLFSLFMINFSSTDSHKLKDNEIKMPCSVSDYKGEQYEEVIKELKDMGFYNVETAEKKDLVLGWITKDGEVYKVSINGDNDFDEGDRFPKDAKVVVTYHTYKD